MKIKISTAADQDLIDGYQFYERQSKGLGMYFLDTLFSDIDSLRIYAGIHAVLFNKYYRLLSKRFPFAIYYQIKNNIAYVAAVLDSRSDPAKASKRLK